mmetsp:Transcript_15878/g.23346  ORF Transcript_15878/g.23346 Transcript_15878/m.23346 type:complete len:121 (-) Transcript_15878:7-369(-)
MVAGELGWSRCSRKARDFFAYFVNAMHWRKKGSEKLVEESKQMEFPLAEEVFAAREIFQYPASRIFQAMDYWKQFATSGMIREIQKLQVRTQSNCTCTCVSSVSSDTVTNLDTGYWILLI